MMLNSRFELSKIEKNTRVEREICLATLENREWKENLFLPLSKIESRKRIVSCHSRKSRVEREMGTIKFSRSREKFVFLLSIFLSRVRLLSMPVLQMPKWCVLKFSQICALDFSFERDWLKASSSRRKKSKLWEKLPHGQICSQPCISFLSDTWCPVIE